MKRTITLRYLFTLCVMTLISAYWGGNLASAETKTATVNAKDYAEANGWSLKKNIFNETIAVDANISMTFSGKGTAPSYANLSGYYVFRINRNTAFTVSATEKNYKIKEITFTAGYSWTNPTPDVGSFSENYKWVSNGNDVSAVTFTLGYACHIQEMTVTYEANVSESDDDPVFTISPDKTLDCLESYTVEAVAKDKSGNKLDGTIEYSISSESSDFTFDKETGVFKAGLSAGTYEVTAEYLGTTGYNSATATCTITVADPGVSSSKAYRLVTSQNQILDGAQYLLVTSYEKKDWAYEMAMSNISPDGFASEVSVLNYTFNNGLRVSAENDALPITLEKVGDYYALKTKYGYVKGEADTYYILYSETCDEALAQWNIVIDEGNAKIYNVYNQEKALMYVYNSIASQFKNYNVSYYGTEYCPAVQLYAKSAEMSISHDALGYGTYAVNFAYQMPEGVKGYAIAGLETENKLKKVEAYSAGAIVPALTPLLVYSEEASAASKMFYPIVVNKDVDSYEEENYLEYKRVSGMTASKQDGDVYYYKLTKNEDKPLGFYWGAVDGAAFSMTKSSSAYLALPQSINAAAGLLFDEAGEATGIQLTPAEETAAPAVYNLQGVRVSGKLAKGLYIVNGKKVLVK